MNKPSEIQTFSSLKEYFLSILHEHNYKLRRPLPESTIIYSSHLMEKFSLSEKLFEIRDGKVADKVLGMNYLEASLNDSENKTRAYKDVAETALFVSGYFNESLERGILDTDYYINIGKMAYTNLNTTTPNFLGVENFFKIVSTYFEMLMKLMSQIALSDQSDPLEHMLLNIDNLSEEELFINGVTNNTCKIVS